ncbi:DUF3710 domain-containing protein [Streptomyces macrolidinus]|uniref:DUF3710 domain-containing protein n=1 Tax=Streptomyces macrolidinus TaxID=2952607 RepID=UPI0035581989
MWCTEEQLSNFRRLWVSARRNWTSIHGELMKSIKGSGGTVKEWAGLAGVGPRAELQIAKPSRCMSVRMLGCDGPRWILRGIVSGDGALRDSQDTWAHSVFSDTVVSPAHSNREGMAVYLRLPEN